MEVPGPKDKPTFAITITDYTKPVCTVFGGTGHETKQVEIEATSYEEALERARELGYTPTIYLL